MATQNLKVSFPAQSQPVEMQPAGTFQAAWYYFFQQLFNRSGGQAGVDTVALKSEADSTATLQAMSQPLRGNTKPPFMPVTPGASPFSFVAPFAGDVVITGGTVSATALSRDGTNFITYPPGVVRVAQGDTVKVTYSAAPTMTMVGDAQ
jgi:hypothetical protein